MLVLLAHRDLPVQPAPSARRDLSERLVPLVHRVLLVKPVQLVLKALPAKLVLSGLRDLSE